ncbi:hypothetical protein ACFLW0_07225 [Chloroflexota bacterium]
MELALAVMMVLGIFVAIPALFGFGTAGVFLLKDRRVRKAERARTLDKAAEELELVVTEAKLGQSGKTETHDETKETIKAI